jgi:putative DNA primase/helicase
VRQSISFTPAEVREYFGHKIPGLKMSGDEWRCPCPIHGGERDSLAINAETGRWRCHSECSTGGDVIEFEMRLEGLDFKRAVASVEQAIGRTVGAPKTPPVVTAVYQYVNREGRVLFEVVRMEPKGFRQRQPDGKGGHVWNIKNVDRVPYRLPQLIASDEVYLVEGEKDVHALEGLGFVATTIPGGATAWRKNFASFFLSKRVTILPDNDDPGREFAAAAAKDLNGIAAAVRIVPLPGLPDKGDVSDWIAAGGTAEALLEACKSAATTSAAAGRKHSEQPLKAQELASRVMHEHMLLTDKEKNVWLYLDNYWQIITTGYLEGLVYELDDPTTSTDKRRQEAIKIVKAATQTYDSMKSRLADDEVPVANGVLNLRTSLLRKHDPEDHLQMIVPWEFDPSAKCPLWMRTIHDWFDGDPEGESKIRLKQEFFGYLLFPRARLKKALFLYGKPDTGKSLALKTMITLVGAQNTCSIDVHELGNSREMEPIRGKLLNAVADMASDAKINTGGFKRVVSTGDMITINPKFKNKEYIEPTAKHVFVTNSLPIIEDDSTATEGRILVIKFNRSIPRERQDGTLMDRLAGEMPGILAWAAHGAARLVENNGVFTEVRGREQELNLNARDSNPFLDFIAEEMIEDEDGVLTNTEIRNKFKIWSGSHNISDQLIGRLRKRSGIETVVKNVGGSATRVVLGYRWRSAQIVDGF